MRVEYPGGSGLPLSSSPPINAVFPSATSATLVPNWLFGAASSFGTSFCPCCVQVDPERMNTHAAPVAGVVDLAADQGRVAVG